MNRNAYQNPAWGDRMDRLFEHSDFDQLLANLQDDIYLPNLIE